MVLSALGLMNITVDKKPGKQQDNFELTLIIPVLGDDPVKAEFTGNSPSITGVEPNVGILCSIEDNIVMARQGNYLASTFNPIIDDDLRVHEYFFKMVKDASI